MTWQQSYANAQDCSRSHQRSSTPGPRRSAVCIRARPSCSGNRRTCHACCAQTQSGCNDWSLSTSSTRICALRCPIGCSSIWRKVRFIAASCRTASRIGLNPTSAGRLAHRKGPGEENGVCLLTRTWMSPRMSTSYNGELLRPAWHTWASMALERRPLRPSGLRPHLHSYNQLMSSTRSRGLKARHARRHAPAPSQRTGTR
mmetsp:Transcript_25298/g.64269  ORF Transcript_25298/g.64269 Transcript_25298/m.64269 type:complete len:201 (-) Transcript_25298:252-854(-)